MKWKIAIIIITLIFSQGVNAQFINTDFENWDVINESNFPTDWTINPQNHCEPNSTIFQVADAISGDYAIMFTAGCVFTDTFESERLSQRIELDPQLDKLTSLEFYYKHINISILNRDSIGCAFVDLRLDHDTEPTTSSHEYFFRKSKEEVSVWTKVEMDLSHLENVKLASIRIQGGSCDTGTSSEGNSEFIIDNLKVGINRLTNTSETENDIDDIKIFPNPAHDQITLSKTKEGYLRIYNSNGTLIHEVSSDTRDNYHLKIDHFTSGNYFLIQFDNKGQSLYRRSFVKT